MARHVSFPAGGLRRERRERLLAQRVVQESLVSVAGLIGRPVRLRGGAEIGRLCDLVARWEGETYPSLTGLLVRVARRRAFVPISHVGEIGRTEILLGSARLDLRDYERRSGEVLLAADVLDHQLVDCDGVQVVRASDLYLASMGGGWRLVGVDVGFQSLLRRLGPTRWRTRPTPERVIDWAAIQPFGIDGAALRLRGENHSLARLRPADLADLLEELGRNERQELLGSLQAASAADALEEMEPDALRTLLHELPSSQAAELVGAMEPDEAVDALRDLDDDEREELLAVMPASAALRLQLLLRYPEGTAGGLMTTRLVVARHDDLVAAVRDRLATEYRDAPSDVDAVAVVDENGQFLGDVTALDLMVAGDDEPIGTLVEGTEPVYVPVAATLETLVDELIDSRRGSLVVVDDDRLPLGRILADDVIDALVPDRGRHRVRMHMP